MQLSNEHVRVGLVHSEGASDCLLSRSIQAALEMSLSSSRLIDFVQSLLVLPQNVVSKADILSEAAAHHLEKDRLISLLHSIEVNATLHKHKLFSNSALQLRRGHSAFLVNGKVWPEILFVYSFSAVMCLCTLLHTFRS